MTTERDPRTRIVLSWLREDTHENAERVLLRALDEVDTTPQRRSRWPAWRTNRMNTYAKLIAAAAAVLVVAIGGYQLLPGIAGPGDAPSPSASLIARGTFVTGNAAVELEATREGSSVTGRMTVSQTASDGDYAFTVDLRCARTTEDGLIMIGGYTTEANRLGSVIAPVGSHAAIVLTRGSPGEATIWTQRGGPAYETSDCLAYLSEKLTFEISVHPEGDWMSPIYGIVELGP